MWLFGKKKKEQEKEVVDVKPADPEYTCLFCGKKFKESEIVFARTLRTPDEMYRDRIFAAKLGEYQAMDALDADGNRVGLTKNVFRRIIQKDGCQVIAREPNGLPLQVVGTLEKAQEETTSMGDGLGFSDQFFDTDDSAFKEEDTTVKSSERICPHCHFTLPEGFSTDKVVRVGLLGGSRSGKTTYMAVVTEYLKNKMGRFGSGLELADIKLLPECQRYQEALYIKQQPAKGAESTPIVGDIKDQMILPMIMHVTPVNENYKPFFLILQDIPGEYLQPETEHFLIQSKIPKPNVLIMLVDINHFIRTEQQERKEFGGYCPMDIPTLFENLGALGYNIPKGRLNSLQCTLTKLDFWIEEEGDKLNNTVFIYNCDDAHKGAIDEDRLDLVHRQITEKLRNIGNVDQSGFLDSIKKSLKYDGDVNIGYTAIASRIVPQHEEQLIAHGADYQMSLNVLEPLMNIFSWEHLLPIKDSNAN